MAQLYRHPLSFKPLVETQNGDVSIHVTPGKLFHFASHFQCIHKFYSISVSPKGWTDQELGATWLRKDFEPVTAIKLDSPNQHRMLILDGHNSHCTYKFCKFAEDHQIIIVCLPSHTTHALQPCDVGVFGPLASCWKAQVNLVSRQYDSITKLNLLEHYSIARSLAMKSTTISSAFRKTGIWPTDTTAIPKDKFEPALNTTTQAVGPPTIIATGTESSSDASSADAYANSVAHLIRCLPLPLSESATVEQVKAQNAQLLAVCRELGMQVEAGHVNLVMMGRENGLLRQRLFRKDKKKPKRLLDTSHSRHMTGAENMMLLARLDWEKGMSEVFKELGPRFKDIRKKIDTKAREEAQAADRVQKEGEKARKAEERAAQRAIKAQEKSDEKARKAEQRAAEKTRKAQEKQDAAAKRAAARKVCNSLLTVLGKKLNTVSDRHQSLAKVARLCDLRHGRHTCRLPNLKPVVPP